MLSVGPGWDWTTLSSLYPNIDVYTEQLRRLEQYVDANPNAADARFLLAYHYMTCGYAEAAAEQLKAAVQLNPQGPLVGPVALRADDTRRSPPGNPRRQPAPAKPVEASALVGNWKASRADGASHHAQPCEGRQLHLEVRPKRQAAGVHRRLRGGRQPPDPQAGRHAGHGRPGEPAGDNRFNFKLPGDNPNDPGLTFGR